MSDNDKGLIDLPLVPDSDADEEMGPADMEAIADEDLRGSRLLLTRRTAEPIEIEGQVGGLVEFLCTFQPAYGTRFLWASLTLRFHTPDGIKLIDLAPRAVNDEEPVQFTINEKGMLGLEHKPAKIGVETEVKKTLASYSCIVQGSGISTAVARWDFRENPHKRDGLGAEHQLVTTLSVTGQVKGAVSVSARLARPGLSGNLTALRDMIIGPGKRTYDIEFEIPEKATSKESTHFLGFPFFS